MTALRNHQLMIRPAMRPFRSADEMLRTHVLMFGDAGRFCAETVLRYSALFDEPLDPLRIRVVLAPVEIGPYNRHAGYTNHPRADGEPFNFILGNRHVCAHADDGSFVLHDETVAADFIVHELTHHRQAVLLKRHGYIQNRGVHRDAGWYGAIAEAAPRYLGVAFPQSLWPKQRPAPGRLTEKEVNEWPDEFRRLIGNGDSRLRPITS